MNLSSVKRMFHWGPIFALGIIKIVSYVTVLCTLQWWPMGYSFGGLNIVIFLTIALLTAYNFLKAVYVGPGFVPSGWHPDTNSDEQYLQYCVICQGFKAPRSHHCSQCGKCVLKMDHHCPWMNCCVGHKNHTNFVWFIILAILGSIHASVLLITTVIKFITANHHYYSPEGLHYPHFRNMNPPFTFSIFSMIMCLCCIGLSIGVFVSLSVLQYIQFKSILRNRTGIEDWIIEKAIERRYSDPNLPPFVYPYDLGWKRNIQQVFTLQPIGDGIVWPVRKGCTQYDLTREQKEQKILKNLRKKPCKVIYKYSGSCFPISYGFRTFCHPPWTIENRLSLKKDDIVLITRVQKYWLFGEKCTDARVKYKGWFPRSCVVPYDEYNGQITDGNEPVIECYDKEK